MPGYERVSRQRIGEMLDLGLEKFGGTVVPQDKVRQLDFSRQRQLLGNALPSERAIEAARLQPGELLLGSTGYADDEIKPFFERFFEEERRLNRPAPGPVRRQRLPPQREELWMRKLFQPNAFRIIYKYPFGHAASVHAPVRLQHPGSVAFPEGVNHIGSGQHFFPHELIRVEALETSGLK